MKNQKKGTIESLDNQGDRVIIRLKNEDSYHIIADPDESAELKIGDEINYAEEGVNFGWFLSKA